MAQRAEWFLTPGAYERVEVSYDEHDTQDYVSFIIGAVECKSNGDTCGVGDSIYSAIKKCGRKNFAFVHVKLTAHGSGYETWGYCYAWNHVRWVLISRE